MTPRDEFDDNPYAAPQTDFATSTDRTGSSQENLVYAGFWQRFFAYFLDQIIVWVGSRVLAFPVAVAVSQSVSHIPLFAGITAGVLRVAVGWLYFALQESSAAKATLGKRALGLKVVDMSGRQVTFGQATGRFFGKFLSSLILGIGFYMQPFTEKKQALHDMLAKTLVIRS